MNKEMDCAYKGTKEKGKHWKQGDWVVTSPIEIHFCLGKDDLIVFNFVFFFQKKYAKEKEEHFRDVYFARLS